jgi:hypothetical protein
LHYACWAWGGTVSKPPHPALWPVLPGESIQLEEVTAIGNDSPTHPTWYEVIIADAGTWAP